MHSQAVSLCFRLHFSKDSTNSAIAAATLRQVVTITFERVIAEDSTPAGDPSADPRASPDEPAPGAGDAFLLFQDLCLLTNGEAPHWLQGVIEMTRTFGLELIETALTSCPALFFDHPELGFLLKERVCSLIIKLFSPSVRTHHSLFSGLQPTPLGRAPVRYVCQRRQCVSSQVFPRMPPHSAVICNIECDVLVHVLEFASTYPPARHCVLPRKPYAFCTQESAQTASDTITHNRRLSTPARRPASYSR